MAALMKIQNIVVYTHDSIGLGEDGPTHQAVEHTASLRLMPTMRVWRPCDAVETAVAWRDAIERRDGPTSLILTRQSVPHQQRNSEQIAAIVRGGYILRRVDTTPDLIWIATGSEVARVVAAAAQLGGGGVGGARQGRGGVLEEVRDVAKGGGKGGVGGGLGTEVEEGAEGQEGARQGERRGEGDGGHAPEGGRECLFPVELFFIVDLVGLCEFCLHLFE